MSIPGPAPLERASELDLGVPASFLSQGRRAPIETITELEATGRLVIAALLGGVIGFDRERRNKAAGIRTHMLVALGAAAFMLVAYFLIADLGGEEASRSGLRLDPISVVQGIVAGVGFIGAGQIFQQRGTVQGLTSAAGIWATAAIGTLVATGHYIVPVAATVLVFVIIAALGSLEEIVTRTDDAQTGEEGDAASARRDPRRERRRRGFSEPAGRSRRRDQRHCDVVQSDVPRRRIGSAALASARLIAIL